MSQRIETSADGSGHCPAGNILRVYGSNLQWKFNGLEQLLGKSMDGSSPIHLKLEALRYFDVGRPRSQVHIDVPLDDMGKCIPLMPVKNLRDVRFFFSEE